MPELPEVETTRRGIAPHVLDRRVAALEVREPRLRWPVPARLSRELPGQRLIAVDRRAKFLLLRAEHGTVIVHLGMSGSLRLTAAGVPLRAHDRVEIRLEDGTALRLHDPRRFGAVLWTRRDPLRHPLLSRLGPEPLAAGFDGAYLHALARGRRAAVKSFLMDGRVVAGVGNIYASEALFLAGIHPARAAGRIGRTRYERLVAAVRRVLEDAIGAGGTTLRDYVGGDGEPGRFGTRLRVYGRAGAACERCGESIRQRVLGQRSSYYCPRCQH